MIFAFTLKPKHPPGKLATTFTNSFGTS